MDELHATKCQDFIASVGGDIGSADMEFDDFDADGNGVVSMQEFLNFAAMIASA